MPARSLQNRIESAKKRATNAVAKGGVPKIFVNTANNEFENVINPENKVQEYYSKDNGYVGPGDVASIFGGGSSVWRPKTAEELMMQMIENPVTISHNSVLVPSSVAASNSRVVLLNNSVAAPNSRVVLLNNGGLRPANIQNGHLRCPHFV